MRAPLEHDDRQPDEREIRTLADRSGVAPAQVRTLFRHERARLGMGAKVHSYLAVLTAANVRGMLRRVAAKTRVEAPPPRVDVRRWPADAPENVQAWEDDGGKVREARSDPATNLD